jgi:hypothetical protein
MLLHVFTCIQVVMVTAPVQSESAFGNSGLTLLPLALFGLIFGLLFRRKIKALRAKISADSLNNPQGGPHNHHPLAKLYFRTVGWVAANTLGRFCHYADQHMAFLASGSVCQRCGQTLLNRSWMPLSRCVDSAGNPVPLIEASKSGAEFECPSCHFRWPLRKGPNHAMQPTASRRTVSVSMTNQRRFQASPAAISGG